MSNMQGKPMRKVKNKTQCQRIHAKRRFLERFGVQLTTADLQRYVALIQAGSARFMGKVSNRVSLWDMPFGDKTVRVVYDKQRKTIVTGYDV